MKTLERKDLTKDKYEQDHLKKKLIPKGTTQTSKIVEREHLKKKKKENSEQEQMKTNILQKRRNMNNDNLKNGKRVILKRKIYKEQL